MGLYFFVAVTLAVVGGYLLYRRAASERERKNTARRAPRHPAQLVRSRSSPSIEGLSLVQQPPPIPPAKDAPQPFGQEQESRIGEAPTQEPQPPETIGGQTASLIEPPASLDPGTSPPVEPVTIQPESINTCSADQRAPGPSVEKSLPDTNEETPTELGPAEVEDDPLMEPAPPADPPPLQDSRPQEAPISEEGEFQSESDITEVSEAAGSEDQTAIEHDETADEDLDLGIQDGLLVKDVEVFQAVLQVIQKSWIRGLGKQGLLVVRLKGFLNVVRLVGRNHRKLLFGSIVSWRRKEDQQETLLYYQVPHPDRHQLAQTSEEDILTRNLSRVSKEKREPGLKIAARVLGEGFPATGSRTNAFRRALGSRQH